MEELQNNCKENYLNFLNSPPSQWGDQFLLLSIADSDFDVLAREIEVLKPKVRENLCLTSSSNDKDTMKKNILWIHFLDCRGLSYLFEKEIDKNLRHAFEMIDYLIEHENDLYTISIMFRVFRTYGHNMLSDVFKRFKGDDGKFKKILIEDVKGMLSLYEAVHFRTTKDSILDEALSFSLDHLETLLKASPPHLVKHIKNALYIPQHMKTPVLVAIEYLSFYEQEKDHDETLLELAKLNFKFLQLHYIQELKTITIWWRGLDYTANMSPGFRERTFEAWFAGLMMYSEPQYSLGRIMSAKLFLIITFVDDACEQALVPEAESVVHCLERWDPDYMENLEGHMKTGFKFVMHVFKEYEEILKSQGRLFAFEKMIEEFKIVARTNLELLKWARSDQEAPLFDEFVEVGGAEVGAYATMACSIMGMDGIGKKEDFEWLMTRPKFIQSLAMKTRLWDDIMDFEDDMGKGYTANGLNYYMKLHGITKEEAIQKFHKMFEDTNKIVNEECLENNIVSRHVLMQVVNYGRLVEVLYTSDDIYNQRKGKLSDYLTALLVDPFGF